MDPQNIFLPQEEINTDLNGKLSYTSIKESIPHNSLKNPIKNWREKYKIEWRWRFLKFHDATQKEKFVWELSTINRDANVRSYLHPGGGFVFRDVDPRYDNYVVEQYYYYIE